ncbi:formimidoylglutamase [Zooshikella marina]|uniref:formimidoylglutamase n=1 Tax=Zooshikella ganghwensis TaxID=202772 RepID=UPI001BB0C95B|nr:formimidoylglutamase [Zooshikella ganghwensis]MBU2707128.1 formimidoylglutamase [Zooshikella ganghwensis]
MESKIALKCWKPTPATIWQGREDTEEGTAGYRWHQQVQCLSKPDWPTQGTVLLGFVCEEGVRRNQGRVGAAGGPEAIRKALANLPWHDEIIAHSEMLNIQDQTIQAGTHTLSKAAIWDGGDVICAEEDRLLQADLTQAQQTLADAITGIFQAGAKPMVLGGGHEVSFGSFLGLAQWALCQPQLPRIGILNVDPHFDIRKPGSNGPSSGTPFYQVAQWCEAHKWPFHYGCLGISRWSNTQALFQRADQWQVQYRFDTQLSEGQLPETLSWIDAFVAEIDWLYLTIDMDVFPAALVPGVSAPAAMGVHPWVVEHIISHLRQHYSHKLMLADVAELNPTYDRDQISAKVAARLVANLLQ